MTENIFTYLTLISFQETLGSDNRRYTPIEFKGAIKRNYFLKKN